MDVLAFLVVAAVVIVTPGQDTALTIRNTLAGARRAGIATAAGVSAGQAVWTLATSVGLAAVVAASEPVFQAIKLAGAAYLVVLGLQSLRDALRKRARAERTVATPQQRRARSARACSATSATRRWRSSSRACCRSSAGESFGALLALGLVFCAMTFVWLSAYAAAVAKAGDVLRRPAIRRVLDAVVGVVLVSLGLRLATERR